MTTTAPTAKSRFCSQCGAELLPDAIFCHSCGVPVDDGATGAGGAVVDGVSPLLRWGIPVAAVVALILLSLFRLSMQ